MEEAFDAEEFFEKLSQGRFNGHLQEELHKLSYDELEQVATLMARRLREKAAGQGSQS